MAEHKRERRTRYDLIAIVLDLYVLRHRDTSPCALRTLAHDNENEKSDDEVPGSYGRPKFWD
jgi:hypothetical protein